MSEDESVNNVPAKKQRGILAFLIITTVLDIPNALNILLHPVYEAQAKQFPLQYKVYYILLITKFIHEFIYLAILIGIAQWRKIAVYALMADFIYTLGYEGLLFYLVYPLYHAAGESTSDFVETSVLSIVLTVLYGVLWFWLLKRKWRNFTTAKEPDSGTTTTATSAKATETVTFNSPLSLRMLAGVWFYTRIYLYPWWKLKQISFDSEALILEAWSSVLLRSKERLVIPLWSIQSIDWQNKQAGTAGWKDFARGAVFQFNDYFYMVIIHEEQTEEVPLTLLRIVDDKQFQELYKYLQTIFQVQEVPEPNKESL